jgi:hypothetical protein
MKFKFLIIAALASALPGLVHATDLNSILNASRNADGCRRTEGKNVPVFLRVRLVIATPLDEYTTANTFIGNPSTVDHCLTKRSYFRARFLRSAQQLTYFEATFPKQYFYALDGSPGNVSEDGYVLTLGQNPASVKAGLNQYLGTLDLTELGVTRRYLIPASTVITPVADPGSSEPYGYILTGMLKSVEQHSGVLNRDPRVLNQRHMTLLLYPVTVEL